MEEISSSDQHNSLSVSTKSEKNGVHQSDHLKQLLEGFTLNKTEGAECVVVSEVQVVIAPHPCPEVLLAANKNNTEIILVQLFSQHSKRLLSTKSCGEEPFQGVNNFSEYTGKTPHKNRLYSDDLDVTGSPLKCPFMEYDNNPDLSPFSVTLPSSTKYCREKLFYSPIPSKNALAVASELNLALCKIAENADNFTPVWVVCDGKDSQGTSFIGLHRCGRQCSRITVTAAGPYHDSETLPSLDHLTRHLIAIGPTKWVESCVEAKYKIVSSLEEEGGCSLELVCRWKKPLTLLAPPALDALTTAKVRVVCSDPKNAAHHMYRELSVLQGFVSGLVTGEVAWLVSEGTTSVADMLNHLFTDIKSKSHRQKREDDDENRQSYLDTLIKSKFTNRGQKVDFTDLLWNVLLRCGSFEELKNSLKMVFDAVSSETIRPQIHVRNATQIGKILRNIMQGKGEVPELTGLTPLHMLIEMGCEKLKREYISIFQAGELATGEQLSWFVSNSDRSAEVTLTQLERLHMALQVVVVLRTFLYLSTSSLARLTTQVLDELKNKEVTSSHSFSLKLETFAVHQLLSSRKENSWEVQLTTGQGSYSKSLVCHISHAPLILIQSQEIEDSANISIKKEEEDEEAQYFCTFFKTVTDAILMF